MDHISKLDQEVASLEQKMSGTPAGDVTTDPSASASVQGSEVAPQQKELVTPTVEPIKPAVQEQRVHEDWEKRYKGLRGSRDEKLYETKRALATAEAKNLELQNLLSEARGKIKEDNKADILEGVISDEAKEALGDTALDAIQKTAHAISDAKSQEIEAELQELRKEKMRAAEQRIKDSQAAAYRNFLTRLENAVPDYRIINKDPAFKAYCQELDVDGVSRADHFHDAESKGNVATIARYMIDFKNTRVQVKNPLEEKITPIGTTTAPSVTTHNNDSKLLTKAEIDLHYERDIKGYYKGRRDEFEAMERRIEDDFMARNMKV